MEGGDGMVAMVRGCGQAGLSVTLFDGGRKYTLMPNQAVNHQPASQQSSTQQLPGQPVVARTPAAHLAAQHQPLGCHARLHHHMERQNSHHSTMTNTEHERRDISAQITDGRYTTVYKMLHCNASPSSPPEQVTEFPPQRPNLVPGHGNFQVGGFGSGHDTHLANKVENSYHGAMVWSDRGAVYSPRSSRQLDQFASSLRRYPSLSPEKSSEVMERLVNYSRNLKQKVGPAGSPLLQSRRSSEISSKALRAEQNCYDDRRLETDLSAIKEDGYRTDYGYMRGRSPFGKIPDVRYIKETNINPMSPYQKAVSPDRKNKHEQTDSYNSMYKDNRDFTQKCDAYSQGTSPRRPSNSDKNLAVSPTSTSSEVSTATISAQDNHSFSTAVENLTLNPSISIQTFCTYAGALLRNRKSVGTTLSSIEFSKGCVTNDLRKSKSEEYVSDPEIEKKLCRWFNSIDEDMDCRILKAKTVLRLKKNISEWGECIKKGIQHVICYKDGSWYSDSDDSFKPLKQYNETEDSEVEEAVNYLLEKIDKNNKEIQIKALQTDTRTRLGTKLKQIVLNFKLHKHQSIKDDLLAALYELPLNISKSRKKIYLEKLAICLTGRLKFAIGKKSTENPSEEHPSSLETTIEEPVQECNECAECIVENKNGNHPKLHSETFVILPTRLVKATNFPSVERKRSDCAFGNKTQDDIKANLVIYIRQLSAKVYEWLECIKYEIPHIEEAKLAVAVNNLAEDIVDRLKYRELSAIKSITTSNETDLENLKYQIFKWINKYVGEDNLTTLRRAPELMKKIQAVPIPKLVTSVIYEKEKIDSNCMLERSNTTNLLETVSEVLPVFKNNIKIDKSRAIPRYDQFSKPSQLKQRKSIVKESIHSVSSLARNARCLSIANMTTNQGPGGRCCSGIPPISGPESRINQINEEYFNYLDDWLKRIPIPYISESDRELANKARMGICNAYLQRLYSLSLDPVKLRNRFYYEDLLDDVLEELFSELPQIPELMKMKPVLKSQLIDKTMNTYELMYKVRDSVSYQQKFLHMVLAMVPLRRRSHERLSDEMEICSFVDEFILSVRYRNEDPDRSKWYREKAFKKIESFVDQLHRYGKIGDDKKQWVCEIMHAMDNVPAPSDEILKEEVDRIKLEEEIEGWYLSLPVIDNEEVYERIRRKNLKTTLVKKIFDMDREINLGDCAGQRELKYEISRFIEKLPLRQDGNLNKNILINTLLTKLKTRTRQREYEHNSRKSVSFDEVFPPPPCCQNNQNFSLDQPPAQSLRDNGPESYLNNSINYSNFQQNIPKASSYNEQQADEDMKFYTLEETQTTKEIRKNIAGNIQGDEYKFYTMHGSGPNSSKYLMTQIKTQALPHQKIHQSHQVPTQSHQSNQVPPQSQPGTSQCSNKNIKRWHEGLHSSPAAGLSALGQIQQSEYQTFDTPIPTATQYQKTNGPKPTASGLHTSKVPGPSGLSRMQKFPPDCSVDSSMTSHYKSSGTPYCDKSYCFTPKGTNPSQVRPSGMPVMQQFGAAPVTRDAQQTSFQYPTTLGGFHTSHVSELTGSAGTVSPGSATPNSIPSALFTKNKNATTHVSTGRSSTLPPYYRNAPSQTVQQLLPSQRVGSSKMQHQCIPCQSSSQAAAQYPCQSMTQMPNQMSLQMPHTMQPQQMIPQQGLASPMRLNCTVPGVGSQMQQMSSHMQPRMSPKMISQVPHNLAPHLGGPLKAVTNDGRPICSPWCNSCAATPATTGKRCKSNKSCMMPGCDNPDCKVPKSKRRKIQELQIQLRKMYAHGGLLEGGTNANFECATAGNISGADFKCRCMEFYIKKCKKARKCTYPFSNCSDVLNIPPCLAFRSPHPCFM